MQSFQEKFNLWLNCVWSFCCFTYPLDKGRKLNVYETFRKRLISMLKACENVLEALESQNL